jgi:hypothetical protein
MCLPFKPSPGTPGGGAGLKYEAAVEEALCFGSIHGKPNR